MYNIGSDRMALLRYLSERNPTNHMRHRSSLFEETIDRLIAYYGPQPPPMTDPLLLILWENVGYLVDDERRREAFDALESKIGADPVSILSASPEALYEVASLGGMLPKLRVEKLLTIARIAVAEFDGSLDNLLKMPPAQARKGLKMFPGIGDPGVDKILLFSKAHHIMALESNGLRVMVRVGFGREQKNYASTYRSVQRALEGQFEKDADRMIQSHLLLRKHGQELCRRTNPICQPCPLRKTCKYYQGL